MAKAITARWFLIQARRGVGGRVGKRGSGYAVRMIGLMLSLRLCYVAHVTSAGGIKRRASRPGVRYSSRRLYRLPHAIRRVALLKSGPRCAAKQRSLVFLSGDGYP